MEQEIIFLSENIKITKEPDGFYIESFKNGMSVEQFNKLMGEHPEIRITSFIAIKNALLFAPRPPVKFGEVKQRITIEISSDELRAYIVLCVMEIEFTGDRKVSLIKEIIAKLNEAGVVFGIKQEVLLNQLCNNKQILIAEGVTPENGEDSVVKMYEWKEAKPEVKEDGNVDHYELNLINRVNVGDWLGERLDPTSGSEGKSVRGNTIRPMAGKKYPLLYDKNTVKEVYESGATTLYSLKSGAVHYSGGKISVSDHLEITGNVDFKTGNIDFDGYLTVKGSIEDNFSVVSNKDVEILGVYGVGSVREITSREGSVFIKGGIAGKNKAVVKSKKDIYTKYVSDATIICDGSVHIGFYCLNSNITAKEVILDSPKGQIIGGNIQAEIKVVSSIIGSASEKRTAISVKGFDRKLMKEQLENVMAKTEELKSALTRAKQELSIFTNTSTLTKEQEAKYENVKDRFLEIKDQLKELEDEKRILVNYLKTHGEGEIVILKKAYPGTVLEMKRITKDINRVVMSTSFYLQDNDIKEL
ncbi:MAG: FapA family protein [Clostridia bacterium]|nr:FapA family protein [Clostridia bacterium]